MITRFNALRNALRKWDKPLSLKWQIKLLKFIAILSFGTGIYIVAAALTFRIEKMALGLIAAGVIFAGATLLWRDWKKRAAELKEKEKS
ncbi:hypothetical protein ES703_30299 [subsurface metagenome]